MEKIDISIIIVSYNSKEYLPLCINSIYKSSINYNFEIIVIDNNSVDGSQKLISKEFPKVILIENKKNVGFARANNQGILLGKGRYLLLLNPDTEIIPLKINLMIDFLERNREIGIVGPRLLNSKHDTQASIRNFPTLRGEFLQNTFFDILLPSFIKSKIGDYIAIPNKPINVDWITGACMLIRKEVIDSIGVFDETFFLYYEEVDLCFRAKKNGWQVFYFPYAEIIHYGGKSTENNLVPSLIEGDKSKYYFFKKHYDAQKISFIRNFTLMGIRIRLFIWICAPIFKYKAKEASERVTAYKNILSAKKELRIGIDTSSVSHSKAGVGCYTKNLYSELSKKRFNNEFLLFNLKETSPVKNKKRRIIKKIIGALKYMARDQIILPMIIRLNGINLFHSPAFICPLIKTSKVIITIHDLAYMLYPDKFINSYRRYLQFWVPISIKIADKIITDSVCSKNDIMRCLKVPESKIEVVYLGKSEKFKQINNLNIIEEFKNRYGLKDDFILYVGTIEPRKNISTLIKAYKKLVDSNSQQPIKLVIAGAKGWKYSDIFKLIDEYKLNDDIIFPGHIPDEELPILYNCAKLFVYPSIYEGFGLPVLEAMACGVPVITSNTSSLPEIVKDAGIMIPPMDEQELSEAIKKVLSNKPLRESLIQKGLKRAEYFSWEKTAQNTLAIYNKVLSKK